MLRLLIFVGIGIGIGGAAVMFVGPPGAGTWTLPVAVALVILSSVALQIARSGRGLAAASPTDIAAAEDAGRSAWLRVDALRQTGTQINDQPLCELDVTVLQRGEPPFRTRVRRIVAVIDVPRFQAGSVHRGVVLLDGGPEIAFVDTGETPPADVTETLRDVTDAGPIREAEPGTVVVGGRRRTSLLGVGRSRRPLRVALYVVALCVAAAAVAAPSQQAIVQTLSAWGEGRLHPDYRSPEMLTQALEDISSHVGHEEIVSVLATDEFVIVYAPVTPGGLPTDSWIYRGGETSHEGPAPSQPSVTGEEFSLSDVAWDRLWPAASDALARAGADDASVSLNVRRTSDSDIDSPTFAESTGPVSVRFASDGDYSSSSFEMTPDAVRVERVD